jgi:hypothetical protein
MSSMLFEPLVNLTDAGLLWTDDVGDLGGSEVLAVALVVRIRDLHEVAFDDTFIALLQADLEVDGLSLVGGTGCLPRTRDRVGLFDLVVGRGNCRQSIGGAEQSADGAQRDGECTDGHC